MRSSGLAGYFFRGDGEDSEESDREAGTLGRMEYSTFCEIRSCSDVAVWRVGYRYEKRELCSKHAVSAMRNGRLWFRQVRTAKE
jgi:hypothetical protein